MDFIKHEQEKNDDNKQTKIPPVSRSSSLKENQLKPSTSRISRTVTPSLSKIPKRAGFSTPRKSAMVTLKPKAFQSPKSIDSKKSSRSTMSLVVTKSTPRTHALASSRSNMNTHAPRSYKENVKSKEPTPRSAYSEESSDRLKKNSERVAARKNILAFENMKEKVRSYQTEFLKKWDMVKSELPSEDGEFKLIGLVKNSDGALVTRNEQKVKIKCPNKSLEQFKKDMHDYVQNNLNLILESLDQFKNSSAKVGDYAKGQECLSALEEVKKKIKIDNLNALGDILRQIESFETCDKQAAEHPTNMNSELEVKVTKLLKEVDELRKNLEQSQKELSRIKKSDEDKGVSFKLECEERDRKLSKKQSEIDELKKKLDCLDKEKVTQKELQEKLAKKAAENADLKEKLKTCAQCNVNQQFKNQEHETRIRKLEADLKAALKDVERRAQIEHSIGDQATKHADEIRSLKADLTSAKKENEKLENELQHLKIESIKDKELDTQLLIFKDKVKQLDTENLTLRQNIKELENKLQISENQICVSIDTNEELTKLKRSDIEKSQKIDVLQMELTKAHFQSQKLEEKIAMDRKLLKVRCSLIESLQSKESTQKIHLEDLFAEVGERNNDIQMLKTELLTKTEEFQNLFSTLSSKQLELTRQEHMIKLLQESNERAQTLRVRQEAKIGRLEEEIAQLKQTISLYQEAVLPNNVLRKNLLMAEASRESDCNDNLGYYVDERRRKRHIDISVKKYEK